MKQSRLKKILALFVAVSMMLLVFNPAVLAEGKDTKHGYGYRQPTVAEKKAFDQKATHAKYVLPNKLAIQRINEARQEKGLEALPESLGVPMGQEMLADKAKSTKTQGITLKAIDQIYGDGTVPAMVDNSTSIAFPEISDQGTVGSCAAFATTYYMATYERARVLGLDAKTNKSNQLSPKYTYNLINEGKDNGSSIFGNILCTGIAGGLTMDEFQYDNNYTAWPTTAQLWRSAYARKTLSDFGEIDASVPDDSYPPYGNMTSGMTSLKTALLDGKVLAFGTYILHWNVTNVDDNPDATVTDDHQGEAIATSMKQPSADDGIPDDGHAMTVVGYDDNIWVDMNGDTKVDPEEMGAIKVANSWGKEDKWAAGNDGFIWVSYEAIKDYYYPTEGKDDTHPSIFDGGIAYWISFSNEAYTPELTATIDLTTNDRYQLTAYAEFNWSEANEPCSEGDIYSENYYQNNYDYDWLLSGDPEGAAVPLDGTVVLDLTNTKYGDWNTAGGALTFCMGIQDSAKAGSQTIKNIEIKNEKTGQTFTPDGFTTNYVADNSMKWFTKKYILNPTAETPPYSPDVASLPALALNVQANKTYHDGDDYSWKFTPAVTGIYKIFQSKPDIDIGVENEARNPLLLTNDPAGTGNIIATLYAGRTYVIDASYEEYSDDGEDADAGNLGSVFPLNANITITQVNTAAASSLSADVANITSSSTNALSPLFNAGVYDYALKASTKDTTITATLADGDAYATIDGKVGTSKTISLNPDGSTLVRVDVFAKDWSKTKTYRIFLYRPKSTDATLSTLGNSTGTLSPNFDKNKTSYTLTLEEAQGSVTLTPLTSDENATFTFGRDPGPSKTVNLDNGGHTTVKINVKPQNGKSKTYSIAITRKPSTNSDLGSLSTTYGTLDSSFTPSDTGYTLTLGEYEKSTKISVTKGIKYQTVSPMSKNVSLETGKSTKVTFTVKPQSGPKKTYTITVVRNASTDATLKSLKGVTLAPTFNKDMLTYTATLPAKKNSVTLSPAVNNKYAKVAYYIGGVACTKKIVLTNPGDSVTVEVRVLAQDNTTTKSYFITITRSPV